MLAAAKYIGAGLATIGLITKNILNPILSNKVITPSVISNQAIPASEDEGAIECVDSMIKSLPLNSIVLRRAHIEKISSVQLLVVNAYKHKGKLVPNKR